MMPTSPHTAQTSSRLICLLNDIAPSPVAINEADMPEQLAQLFDFSSSVSLSKAYGKLATTPFQPGTENSASLRHTASFAAHSSRRKDSRTTSLKSRKRT